MKITKFRNFQILLDLFRRYGKVSQSVLAQRSGLQASTVSNLCKALRSMGIVAPDGKGTTTPEGGRPSEVLALQTDALRVNVTRRSAQTSSHFEIDLPGNIHPVATHSETAFLIADDGRIPGAVSAQCALHYHQIMAGLREAPVLAFHLDATAPCCAAAFSGEKGLIRGAHGQAAWLPGLDWSAPHWETELEQLIANCTRFLDPVSVGLNIPWPGNPPARWKALVQRLQSQLHPVSLHVAAHAQAALLGAAWQSQDIHLKESIRAYTRKQTAVF